MPGLELQQTMEGEEMTTEEYVEHIREQMRKRFGEVGKKDDCVHITTANGHPYCKACSYWKDGNNCRKAKKLQCEKDVCYFYKPRRKKGKSNENQSNA